MLSGTGRGLSSCVAGEATEFPGFLRASLELPHDDACAVPGDAGDVAHPREVGGPLGQADVVAAENLPQHGYPFHQGETRTDAPAHSAAERDPGVRRHLALEEPFRPERRGVLVA